MKTKKSKLITNRLVLQSLRDEDLEDFINIVKDPLVNKSYMLPDLLSKEQEKQFFDKIKNFTNSNKYVVYGIYLNDRVIGLVNSVSFEKDEMEIGYFISSKEWNHGYATEAFEAVIQEVFRIGFKSVIAAHFSDNHASGAVMKKCGLKRIDKEEIIEYRNQKHLAIYYQIKK